MSLSFRNLNVSPSDPVDQWPTEAVQTALERGDLGDWQRLTTEIRKAPWGTTARQVEEILTHSRPYGVADAMEQVLARARARRAAQERDEVATEVQRAIARSGMRRTQLAACLGTSASRLSTYATGKVTPSATFMVRLRHIVGEITGPTD